MKCRFYTPGFSPAPFRRRRHRDWRASTKVKLLMLFSGAFALGFSVNAFAHGERAQEPSLRLSTIQWYDTKWSTDHIGVNQELTLSGRFHVMANWKYLHQPACPF
jgi:hypothetical protein